MQTRPYQPTSKRVHQGAYSIDIVVNSVGIQVGGSPRGSGWPGVRGRRPLEASGPAVHPANPEPCGPT